MIKPTYLQGLVLIICVLGFGVFLAPVFSGILNAGNTLGMAFFALLASAVIFRSRLSALMAHKPVRIAAIVLLSVAGVLLVLALIISAFMIKAANNRPEKSSTVIVLGCRVKNGGPSLMLAKRINAAYDYLSENPDACAVLSGGQGPDEAISEAQCMFNELVKKGISPDRLYLEDKSTNTYENIRFSSEIMRKNGLSGDVTIVTNEFHQCRAQIIAKKQGIKAYGISAPTALFLLPTYWIRDCLGVAYETVF